LVGLTQPVIDFELAKNASGALAYSLSLNRKMDELYSVSSFCSGGSGESKNEPKKIEIYSDREIRDLFENIKIKLESIKKTRKVETFYVISYLMI